MKTFYELLEHIAIYGTCLAIRVLGGGDKILIFLLVLMFFDFVTGVIGAACTRTIKASIAFTGLTKKVYLLVLVAVANIADWALGNVAPIRELVILFYISQEGLSLIENVGEFVVIPESLRKYFTQLNEEDKD